MGAVTDGALDAGGDVTGVIPKFMVNNGWCYHRLVDVIVTADMHQRKQTMSDMADAVIAMPGGVGTLEELLETLTWRQLGLVKVPVIILNTMGYYDVGFIRRSELYGSKGSRLIQKAVGDVLSSISKEDFVRYDGK